MTRRVRHAKTEQARSDDKQLTRAPRKHALHSRRSPSLIALLLVLSILLVFNLSVWRVVKEFEQEKKADLIERLRSVGRTVAHDLKVPFPPIIMLISGSSREVEQLQDFVYTDQYEPLVKRLNDLQTINDLAQIVLLTAQGNVVADSTGASQPGDPYPWSIDRHQFEQAARGRLDQWLFYTVGGQPYVRVYTPFTYESRILGVLQVAARPDFLAKMQETRRRVLLQSFISSALLLFLGILIYRLFSYIVQVEKSAMQGARIEAMGALAGGIAHELRNPLSIIRALAEEIVDERLSDPTVTRNSRDIISEVERLNEIASNFLSLSRPPENPVISDVDLGEELERVTQMMRKTAAARASTIETKLPDNSVIVKADQRALRQVFLNLLLNANEALPPKGGMISVQLHERRGEAEVIISDNGHGIAKRDLNRIFEPFYTTKTLGSGLGLSISRKIIEDVGGRLTISSAPGRGTQVYVVLPAVGTLLPQPEKSADLRP